jgi:hypothetical protein
LPPNTYSNRIGGEKKPQVLTMILLDANNTAYRLQSEVWINKPVPPGQKTEKGSQ